MKKTALLLLAGLIATNSFCITGCDNSEDIDESDIYFPAAATLMDYPVEGIQGTLTFDGKYLLIRVEYEWMTIPGTKFLIIWPYGYSVNVEEGEIQILDESGQVAARVGDFIKLGGGGVPKEIVEEYYIREPLPDDCQDPYWDDKDDGMDPYYIAYVVEVVEQQ